jgi:hypothetical protein
MTDLLYGDLRAAENKRFVDLSSLKALQIKSSFSRFYSDFKKLDRFFHIASLKSEGEVIIYRQAIIKDFAGIPLLLSKLFDLFNKAFEYYTSYNDVKKQFYSDNSRRPGGGKVLDFLTETAWWLKKLLILQNEIYDLFAASPVGSDGLRRYRDHLSKTVRSDEYHDLLKILTLLESKNAFMTGGALEIRLSDGANMTARYILPDEKKPVDTKSSGIKRLFKRKTDTADISYGKIRINENLLNDPSFASSFARPIIDELSQIIKSIHSEFSDNLPALEFYDVAVAYVNYLTQRGIDFCYPQLGKTAAISGLKDLYLLTVLQDQTVVSNDFSFKNDKNGILIIGENGSGKTVYLRSIASSYLLANAGLPIPADDAVIDLPEGIFVMMASSERDLERDGHGGRFESEVSDLAQFVHNVESGSLVFLNEIFQSTSYDEGAMALYSVLNHFSNKRVKWILVTHLEQMITMFDKNDCVIIQKAALKDGYKFIT